MRKKLAACFTLLILCTTLYAQQKTNTSIIEDIVQDIIHAFPKAAHVGVLPFSDDDSDKALYYENKIASAIQADQNLTLLAIRDRKTILAEINYQLSGMVDDNSIVSLGHHLGTEFLVIGTVSGFSSEETLTIKIINIATSEYIFYKTYILNKKQNTKYKTIQ